MFGIGWSEFILIALVLLIFVGPKQLPALLKKAGMIVTELKRAGRELQHQVTEEVRDLERTVGSVKSPSAMLRETVEDIAYDTYDPYKDVTDSVSGALSDEAPSGEAIPGELSPEKDTAGTAAVRRDGNPKAPTVETIEVGDDKDDGR